MKHGWSMPCNLKSDRNLLISFNVCLEECCFCQLLVIIWFGFVMQGCSCNVATDPAMLLIFRSLMFLFVISGFSIYMWLCPSVSDFMIHGGSPTSGFLNSNLWLPYFGLDSMKAWCCLWMLSMDVWLLVLLHSLISY